MENSFECWVLSFELKGKLENSFECWVLGFELKGKLENSFECWVLSFELKGKDRSQESGVRSQKEKAGWEKTEVGKGRDGCRWSVVGRSGRDGGRKCLDADKLVRKYS